MNRQLLALWTFIFCVVCRDRGSFNQHELPVTSYTTYVLLLCGVVSGLNKQGHRLTHSFVIQHL
jgi:hypothetical protein